ncbi:MAG: cyclic nucleotide-binding domain-containing protein [Elusimicrobia bacterium]|nr:cyclic nucleotide-binding domain-containing protein [Elusimicrobiota bacterium]
MFKLLKKLFTDPELHKKKVFLRSLELFKDLSSKDLGFLVRSLHSRTYKEGEVIFEEGDIGRAMFILETGRVELGMREAASGKTRKIFTLESGDFFGEMAMLERLPRSASARAIERSHIHLLYRANLEEILHYHPRIGVSVMTHLAHLMSMRLRHANKLALVHQPPTYG